MPLPSQIPVKFPDGTTATLKMLVAGTGSDPAIYKDMAPSNVDSERPMLQIGATESGSKKARRVRLTVKVPQAKPSELNTVTTIQDIVPVELTIALPNRVEDKYKQRAVAYLAAALADASVQKALYEGYVNLS